jgi:hypothetical protein
MIKSKSEYHYFDSGPGTSQRIYRVKDTGTDWNWFEGWRDSAVPKDLYWFQHSGWPEVTYAQAKKLDPSLPKKEQA